MPRARKPRTKPEAKTPWFPIALACLFAAACAADAKRKQNPRPRRSHVSFQVDADSELYPVAQQAAEAWSKAIGMPVLVSPDGEIPIFITDSPSCTVPDNLAPGQKVGACSKDVGTPSQRIEVPSYLPNTHWLTAITHEMGHHLRGRTRVVHTNDPNSLMYAHIENGRTITPTDVDFVCEENRSPDESDPLDCHPT